MKKSKLKIQNHPGFTEERKYWRRGCRTIVGLDEAGRGPLAGPVVAAAVTVIFDSIAARSAGRFTQGATKQCRGNQLSLDAIVTPRKCGARHDLIFRDSKKLTGKQREYWYGILTAHPDIKWGVGIASEKIIDKINIFEATKLAMKKAIIKLTKGCNRMISDRLSSDYNSRGGGVDFLILDGNFTLEDLPINQKAIVKADEKVFSCAAASIIAKVTRDRIMLKYAKKYPQYGFEKHKGYGTRAHFECLKKYGPCKIHRRSFKPIKDL
jgi:ribonuclease HII